MPHIYSGVCLAAMFSSIIHEHRRLKGEASKIKATVKALSQSGPRESGRPAPVALPALMGLA
ncbi:MAG: hypothetical protein LBV21_01675 [Candidatus Adiutrix sp.]|nr:hypothetical protein [Candidatus Adiutrix sp.]